MSTRPIKSTPAGISCASVGKAEQFPVPKSDGVPLLTIEELSRESRLSVATLHRLKKGGKIQFFQPAGKGGKLLFPADAIERSAPTIKVEKPATNTHKSPQHLSGASPKWML